MEDLTKIEPNTIIAENDEKNQEEVKNASEQAILKLTEEAKSVSGQNVPAIAIFQYLMEKVADDVDFAACVINEEKTLSKCFTHITETALNLGREQNPNRKQGEAFMVGMSDTEIFGAVNEYYQLSDREIENRKAQKLKEIEAAREAAEKIRADEAKKREEKKQEAKAAKEAKAKKKAEDEAKKEEDDDAQFSLFDVPQDGEDK